MRTPIDILVHLAVLISSIPGFKSSCGPLAAPGSLQGWLWPLCPHLAPRAKTPLLPSSQGLEQDVLQAIDRAIEAVHNAAMRDGGKYSLEQRGILQ